MKSKKQSNLSREQALKMGKMIAADLAKENELVIELAKIFDLRLDVEWNQENETIEKAREYCDKRNKECIFAFVIFIIGLRFYYEVTICDLFFYHNTGVF